MGVNRSGAGDREPDKAISAGTLVSHYRIMDRIASGGMGDVYTAEDVELGRTVAVKFLPQNLSSDAAFRSRFEREAKIAASLNHPNIVTIYEFGEYRESPFIAMEHVEGKTLDELLAGGALPVEQAANIAVQLCRGLAEAHDSSLIHRDINPRNIVVDDKGRAKILDFGLARPARQEDKVADDARSGTLSYMSPEQVNGEEIGPASDLFSVGVVFYQMLSGRLPFTGDYEASIVYSIVNDVPPPLGRITSGVPSELELLVQRLLEKDPHDRFQTAGDVAEELDRCLLTLQKLGGGNSLLNGWRGLVVTILAVAAVTVLYFWWPFRSDDRPGVMAREPVLAVMPFDNLGAAEDDYFAEGVADEIVTRLFKFGQLKVISRFSTAQYRDTDKDLQTVGNELGCRYLVTGQVHWDRTAEPSRVRINASLVDVVDGSQLWAESYEGVHAGIFGLQSDIAASVTNALNLAVGESEQFALRAEPTADLQAYDFFLRGNQYFNTSWGRDDVRNATLMFERAVTLDSTFALAWAMLSRAHASMYWEYHDRSQNRSDLARLAADRALNLQPDLPEGHLALGYYYYHCMEKFTDAQREFETALERCTNNAELYNAIAVIQRRTGHLDSSLANFQKALELDPRSHLKAFDVGLVHGLLRQYAEADTYLDRTILLCPDWDLPHIYKAWLPIFRDGDVVAARAILEAGRDMANLVESRYYWWLSRIVRRDYDVVLRETRVGTEDSAVYFLHCAQMHRLLGQVDRERSYCDSARALLQTKLQEHPDDARYHSYLGLAYAGLRQKDSALLHGQRAVELLPTTRDAFDALFLLINLAETLVILGEYDAAVQRLEFMLSIPGFVSKPYLKLDPLWEPLHDHPGWPALTHTGS
ncbi:MAG: protein kinase [Candidatus Zixiibacteriota bacterium]|nr:MAG: protein kinase [candidate division Zixibacteria bacterium]